MKFFSAILAFSAIGSAFAGQVTKRNETSLQSAVSEIHGLDLTLSSHVSNIASLIGSITSDSANGTKTDVLCEINAELAEAASATVEIGQDLSSLDLNLSLNLGSLETDLNAVISLLESIIYQLECDLEELLTIIGWDISVELSNLTVFTSAISVIVTDMHNIANEIGGIEITLTSSILAAISGLLNDLVHLL